MLQRIFRLNQQVERLASLLTEITTDRCRLLQQFRDTMLTGLLRNIDSADDFHRNTFSGDEAVLAFYRFYKTGALGQRLPVPIEYLERLVGATPSTLDSFGAKFDAAASRSQSKSLNISVSADASAEESSDNEVAAKPSGAFFILPLSICFIIFL